MLMETAPSLTSELARHLDRVLGDHDGWVGFDQFMDLALYTPGLGYYARDNVQFGNLPLGQGHNGSDFATAPGISRYFGQALAVQVAQALQQTGTRAIWEFGAGTGALARQLLATLGAQVDSYTIVDLSGALRQRQHETLQDFGDKVHWVDHLPDRFDGVVVGNEVLDAMPVKLLVRLAGAWQERGVIRDDLGRLAWSDRPTNLRPPTEIDGGHDYLTELHQQADGFMRMLVDRLARGAVLLLDYGFPEREYYHPQRSMGTVMCHQAHRMDDQPLLDVGAKDITAHVNFTGIALAAQEAADAAPQHGPWHMLGYTSQARFLINCGLMALVQDASLAERSMAEKLVLEHEMGELFKVIFFCRSAPWDAVGFTSGDRSHNL
jgi:SAM-dependent MidA family methyltransferase